MPTRRRAKRRTRKYDGKNFWDLLWGPTRDDPNAPSIEFLKEQWETGGREAIMGSYFDTKAGARPWAWWRWDFPEELKREAEKNRHLFSNNMDLLEWSGYARPGEREAFERERKEEERDADAHETHAS